MIAGRDGVRERRASGQLDVEVQRIGGKTLDRTRRGAAVLHEGPGDDLDASAAGQGRDGNLVGLDIAVTRRFHLFLRRQVDPELEAAHAPLLLLWHLGMHDAAAGGHPLHATALEIPGVAEMIFVPQMAVEHVGHRLETAVRMRRKTGDVIVGVLGGEVVEHQERVEPRPGRLAEAATQLDTRSVRGGNRFDGALQGTCVHDLSNVRPVPRMIKIGFPRLQAAIASGAARRSIARCACDSATAFRSAPMARPSA